jgi:hypothetical protein
MTEKNSKALVPVNQVSSACLICGKEGHSPLECTLSVLVETQISEVNYAQNQGVFSQSYNPAWRNHPNLSYKNANQQSYPQAVQQNYAQTTQQNFRPQGNMQHPQQQHQANQQNASSNSSQSEISEMMRLQKEMFSGMQETMKMQSELFYKTMQQLTAGISNNPGNQPENKLPAQAEKNPKQCGAISTTEVVDAVTTRSGVNTEPLLKTPTTVTYVAPPRRTTIQQQTTSEASVPMHEKPVEPIVETQNPAAKPTEKYLLQKVPFPERLD